MSIEFAFPWRQLPLCALAGAVFLALVIFGLLALERRRRGRVHTFVKAELAPRLLEGYDEKVRRPLVWLTILGALMLTLALAQPRWGQAWVETQRGSRDILVLLDTSESMNAQNPLPNRLERARQKIESLMDLCPGDRFGIIAFSGEAALQCPLTLDQGYVRSVLHAIDTNTLSEEGTDIAEALREAEKVFEEDIQRTGEENRSTRVILLVSDGEQVSGDAVKTAKEMGRYAGIYVMGIGDPDGAQVTFPQWMTQYVRVKNPEEPHLSKLDEKTLSQIGVEGGGAYVRSTPDNADIHYIQKDLEAVQARATSGELRFSKVNRFRWPLSVAMVCFAGEGLWVAAMPWLRRRNRTGAGERRDA
jgi:Ca-activated chloride channel family protein